MSNYIIVKIEEDGRRVALTKPAPKAVAQRSLVRFRNIGIEPIELEKKGVKKKTRTN